MKGRVRFMNGATGEIKEFNLNGVDHDGEFGDEPWVITAVEAAAQLLPHLVWALDEADSGRVPLDVEVRFNVSERTS